MHPMKPVFKRVLFSWLLVCLLPLLLPAQVKDTLPPPAPPVVAAVKDSLHDSVARPQSLLSRNRFINTTDAPVLQPEVPKKRQGKEFLFYTLAALVLVLAFFRYFFARYFANLFQVFFNTSLRQSQLTDQLLQARLPSLLFNIFFVVAGGFYTYSLLIYFRWVPAGNSWLQALICIGAMGLVYLGKYLGLKFTGWITGFKEVINNYIFIVFLINKIIGILLIPVVILMAFSDIALVKVVVTASIILVLFMLLLRFLRSYGNLHNQLKISRFHFFLYLAGVELLPLLLIYKGLMILFSKNL